MDYEDDKVFKYVNALLQNKAPKNFQITTFSKHHDQVGEKLTELKNIIIKYCPPKDNENLLNAALFDIFECEAELESHSRIEDSLFVPVILSLERRVKAHEG
jgi:regulator of cell morphogenesis and NO signaling